jgi:hypothetical protein
LFELNHEGGEKIFRATLIFSNELNQVLIEQALNHRRIEISPDFHDLAASKSDDPAIFVVESQAVLRRGSEASSTIAQSPLTKTLVT